MRVDLGAACTERKGFPVPDGILNLEIVHSEQTLELLNLSRLAAEKLISLAAA